MKKYLIVLALGLSACKTLPTPPLPDINTPDDIVIDGEHIGSAPAPKMPELPSNLAQKAHRLPDLTDATPKGLQDDAARTDRAYNDVAHRLNNIIDAWNCVKKALNDGTDAAKCFEG